MKKLGAGVLAKKMNITNKKLKQLAYKHKLVEKGLFESFNLKVYEDDNGRIVKTELFYNPIDTEYIIQHIQALEDGLGGF